MTKELTSLIEEIKNGKISEMTSAAEFLPRFKEGIAEEPEKIGELLKAFYIFIKKTRPHLNLHIVWDFAFKNLSRYCFLADKAYYEIEFTDSDPFVEHLLEPKNYGPATKALSGYLGCDGQALVRRIFARDRLN